MGHGRTGAGVGAGGQAGCVDWGPEIVGVPPPAPWHRHAAGQCSSCPWNFATNGLPFIDVVRMSFTLMQWTEVEVRGQNRGIDCTLCFPENGRL